MKNITENAIEIVGKEAGLTSVILAGVHGDEYGGIEAIKEIVSNISIQKGKVFFILGNPLAIQNNVRFVEANLNRMFADKLVAEKDKQSYEYKRAQFLKGYLDQADALLDIHSSFTPKSKPFIITEANTKDITKFLPFDLVVTGFDAVEPGGTDYYMNTIRGSKGICVECGHLADENSANVAKESVYAFLKVMGHIEPNDFVERTNQSFIHIDNLYYTKTNKFILAKGFEDFEKISAGQILAKDGEESVIAEKDGIILFARNRERVNDEGFLSGEYTKTLI